MSSGRIPATAGSTELFLAFEGPEGSGKSSQARLLVDRLRENGADVLFTREPGGTPLSDELRELLLLRKELKPTARAEALLMCTARAQLVEDVLRPALADGRVVVCDRYAGSTLAYQGYGRRLDLADLRMVLAFATGGLWPDLTFLLDIPPEEGLKRKLAQGGHDPAAWDRIESEALEFHERVRAGYLALAHADPEHWRVLDGRAPMEQVAEQIWAELSALRSIL